MQKLLKQLPVQILLAILLAILLTPILSKGIVGLTYSFSCLFKDMLMLFLPIVIFSYMFASMLKFAKSAPLLILIILITISLSNMVAFIIPYFVSQFLMSFFDFSAGIKLLPTNESIQCLIQLPIPGFWAPRNGMIFGLILGVALSFLNNNLIPMGAQFLKNKSTDTLNKYFIPLLPLFIFGFFTKLQYEGSLATLISGYGKVLFLVVIPIFSSYLLFLFFIINRFSISATLAHLKDCMSAFITGFSTMSSIAAMPLMLKAAEKKADKDYVDFIIPSVINIHMIGDGIIFAITIVAISHLFHVSLPSFFALFSFIGYFVLAHFSVAGVPGGATVIIAPLTAIYLGFSSEMVAIFITLGILQDGFITLANVAGNILYSQFSYNVFGKKILKLS